MGTAYKLFVSQSFKQIVSALLRRVGLVGSRVWSADTATLQAISSAPIRSTTNGRQLGGSFTDVEALAK